MLNVFVFLKLLCFALFIFAAIFDLVHDAPGGYTWPSLIANSIWKSFLK